jgi:hypothetical protein
MRNDLYHHAIKHHQITIIDGSPFTFTVIPSLPIYRGEWLMVKGGLMNNRMNAALSESRLLPFGYSWRLRARTGCANSLPWFRPCRRYVFGGMGIAPNGNALCHLDASGMAHAIAFRLRIESLPAVNVVSIGGVKAHHPTPVKESFLPIPRGSGCRTFAFVCAGQCRIT